MTGFPYEPGEALVTFVDVLRWRALQQPEQRTFTFLAEGETEEGQLTAAELDRRARAIGALLQRCGAIRERVLLLFPPGLDFIAAFFGCLYGAAVAVPAYPPEPARLSRTLPRLRSVVADSRPSVVLTTSAVLALAEHLFDEAPELRALRWVATDDVPASLAADWLDPAVDGDTLAFLQYTSGSTAAPKGVMVSHRNLLTNQHAIRLIFQNTRDCICVSWLPTYHDMGLIGQVLHPLYVVGRSVLMSSLAFLQHPVRWLRAVSRYRATLCTPPNFAT